MGVHGILLLCVLLATVSDVGCIYPAGTDFITSFVQNGPNGLSGHKCILRVSGLHDNTSVSVNVIGGTYSTTFTINSKNALTLTLPEYTEVRGSGVFSKIVTIKASHPIIVLSLHEKFRSAETTVLLPVSSLSTVYYLFTPKTGSSGSSKVCSVLATEETTVEIHTKGFIHLDGKDYKPNSVIPLKIAPFEGVQILSPEDLSGSKVIASKPVAILCGHTCAQKNVRCNHVIEQLLPVSSWGLRYYVAPVSVLSQKRSDTVNVIAAGPTKVTYTTGDKQEKQNMEEGQVLEIEMPDTPLYIEADKEVEVIFLSLGGKGRRYEYSPFMMNVLDMDSYCSDHVVFGQRSIDNYFTIVAENSAMEGITIDGKSLKDPDWKSISGTGYSWVEYNYGNSATSYRIEHPSKKFGLQSFGISSSYSYGCIGACVKDPGPPPPSCKNTVCPSRQVCVIQNGKPQCVKPQVDLCWAFGDPHFKSLDHMYYDFMGTCTYTFAKVCQEVDKDLHTFTVSFKNDNRGNARVSYVAEVTLQTGGHTIVVKKGEDGNVRVDNSLRQLPISLLNGTLIMFQSGYSAIIQLGNDMMLSYDWNQFLWMELTRRYAGKMCGMCGNYNQNSDDDFLTPSGSRVSDAIAFGASWAVKDGTLCWHDCRGPCLSCPPNVAQQYTTDNFCGLISKTKGPFSDCHSVLDPKMYMDNCVFDVCINSGYKQMACQALSSYADVCQRAGVKIKEWRGAAGCPLPCPADSTYKFCGSACQATCDDPEKGSVCTEPCVEVCECNAGFVLSHGKCVPRTSCGCRYNGFTYSPNEEFWNDTVCRQKCVCNPQTHKIECKTSPCRTGEECAVKNGILDCHPTTYGVCTIPHYLGFDGQKIDFQGDCVYLLAGLSDHTRGLTDFQVRVWNQKRGNIRVSYTSAVYISAYGTEFEATIRYPNKVIVNNTLQNLPYKSPDGHFTFYRNCHAAVFSFSFGLQVTFDYKSVLTVTIPGTYSNAVFGLCGNYNKDPKDDLIPKGGKDVTDAATVGKSWKVKDVPNCRDDGSPVCKNLQSEERRQREGAIECGILVNQRGPFRDCHALVDPEQYFTSCVYDFCILESRQNIYCSVLTSYMMACQAAGVTVQPWRTQNFCPLSCPAHSSYEVCADPCPVNCYGLSTPNGCSGNCTEGCVCNDGYVLSGGDCVPISQCGCSYNGAYYSVGESVYVGNTCSQKCTCNLGGVMSCASSSCGTNEECRVEKAVLGCHPAGSATCNAAGYSNYRSFDGLSYKFQGQCSYVLAQSCSGSASDNGGKLEEFKVITTHQKQESSSGVVETVTVETNGFILTLRRERRGVVEINGTASRLPATLLKGKVRAECYGKGTLIKTSYGLQVRFDHMSYIAVTVPGNYRNAMCGLCGNYNGKESDDGPASSDLAEFGNKWKAPAEKGNKCGDCGSKGKPCSQCPAEKQKIFSRRNYCGIINDPSGPFAKCHSVVNPASYVDECISDLCQTNGEDSSVLCNSVYVYADACRFAEVKDITWRSDAFCPFNCGPHSHYRICANMCSTTCAAMSDLYECSDYCDEGCECDEGHVFDGTDCLPLSQCGCYENGVYYKANEVVLNDDCSQECTCNPVSGVSCRNKTCSESEKCLVTDGVRACVNTDPCKSKTCRVKESCQVQDGVPVCVPEYNGLCQAWGDPHYVTFDGFVITAQGTCTYILAQYTNIDTDLVPFKITTKNDNRGSQAYSFVKKVELTIYDIAISVQVGEFPKIRVNDELINLPATLANGKLNAYRSGFTCILEANNGFRVTFDWDSVCTVAVPSSYYGLLSGLCGDFDQDPNNDQRAPDGRLISSITDWLVAWKEDDKDPFCFDSCTGDCLTCNNEKKGQYGKDDQCGLILKKDGPFRECIGKISADNFYDACIFDVCASEGAKAILCQALETFSTACLNEGTKLYDWRTPSNCPKMCEDPNSNYTPCGNACPASCSDRTAPAKCKKPCVEACECNKGMVLSGSRCVPISSCGCQYNGQYYEPDQSWYDEKCTVLCKCDPELGMTVCQPTSCKTNEACMVAEGKRGCFPTQYATCKVSGNLHYTTFDKVRFNYTNTCIYQLVKVTSDDPSLVKFAINVQNEHRGNRAVAFTKEVTLEVYNKTITMSRDFPQRIKVDGQYTCLPYYYESTKIVAYTSGLDVIVRTDFNLKMSFDGWSHVRVVLPSTYTGAVSGLCGNNNKDPSDDFTISNGVKAKTGEEFGTHWKVGEVKGCESECTNCPKCTDADMNTYKSDQYCGLLIKADGPFGKCHASVDPTSFFEGCISDACAYKGHQSVVCNFIASYVSECQKNGSVIKEWRTPSFCEQTCPPNSHYELLGDGCPVTCFGLIAPPPCLPTHTEGCYCNNGFIRSDEDCVPIPECGCVYENTYYKTGQEFYIDNLCHRKCTCGSNGITTCQNSPCGSNTECKIVDGVLGCHPKELGQCVAWGDPHYITLDLFYYSFQGICSYTFIRIKSIDFEVIVENEAYQNVAVTKSVTVRYGIYIIRLDRGKGRSALINGERYNLPIQSRKQEFRINQQGNNIIIWMKEGITIMFDQLYYATVWIPSTFSGSTEGLCGDFNKNPGDDTRLPNGTTVSDVTIFGESWSIDKNRGNCRGCSGDQCPKCDQADSALASSPTKCGMISDPQGPFKECHQLVKPEQFVKSCVFDVCNGGGGQNALCASLQAYTALCQEKGANVGAWRSNSNCLTALTCPANSHYSPCIQSCDFTCYSLLESSSCSKECFEGCECDPGYVYDGDQCITMDKCGCVHNKRYLKVNETVLNEDCSQECTCSPVLGVLCRNRSCADDEICQIRDGLRSCFIKDPCKYKTCRVKESCKVQNEEAVCVPDYHGQCLAWGDPHELSFDGKEIDHQGTCTYIFAQYDGKEPGLERFKVTIKNDNRGSQAVSYVARVNIIMYGVSVTIQVGDFNKIRVNGELMNLPVTLADGRLKVSQSGMTARVEAQNNVTITYDWNWMVTVSVPSTYYNVTSGQCGNFNQDPSDDQSGRKGTLINSVTDWLREWKVEDQDPFCFDVCPGKCPNCDEKKKVQYQGNDQCGLLLKEDGPFRECIKKVNPQKFFDACLFDLCINDGAKVILCQALDSYGKICLNNGIKVYDWRTVSDCPMLCSIENSHYNACGNACPATCSDKDAPAKCTRSCVETCECKEGMVLSANKCVPKSSCGCNHNGRYYEPNQSWHDEKCSTFCRCDSDLGKVVCQPNKCKQSETCTVVNGVRGCHPTRFSTCTTHGDPHHESFDKNKFAFMGACKYMLVTVTNQTLPTFNITVDNEKCANGAVSFTKSVSLHMDNHTITLSRDHPQQIKVDDTLINVPYFHAPTSTRAYYSGALINLQTSFGLDLSYGNWNYLRVRLPNTYRGAVSGLCGNNNDDPSDDFVLRDGTKAKDAKEFGDHWKVGEIAGCNDKCYNCSTCNDQQRKVYESDEYCGLLMKSDGPFGQCHASINPKPFFNDCLFDACEYKGHQSVICDIMASYVYECQRNGSVIKDWRTSSFCEMTCPPNSHYELLGNGCPATCVDLTAPRPCEPSYTEGCYCDNGFIHSGEDCVSMSKCGCVFENIYYKAGQEFYPDSLCRRKCTCGANGKTTCQESSCGANAECKVVDGVPGCHPREFGQCIAWGDPHLLTPDIFYYSFQGTCTYILLRAVKDGSIFEVIVDNEPYNNVAVTKSVTVRVGNHIIYLTRGGAWSALINEEQYNLPVYSHRQEFWIIQQGNNVFVQTKEGFTVMFDRQYFVSVWIPSTYSNLTEGLCGNYNKNPRDEFRLPNGTSVSDVTVFGQSWAVAGDKSDCKGCSGDQCPKCNEATSALARSSKKCGIITDPKGPFKDCHRLVQPTTYLNSCVYDLCNGRGGQEALCGNLQAYTALCQEKGGKVEPWRDLTSCPLSCPPNSHYSRCTQSCKFTCYGILESSSCSKTCFEGCECDNGYAFDGENCVTLDKCGCSYNRRYLKYNESIFNDKCTQECTCDPSRRVICVNRTCAHDEKCQLLDGVRSCVSTNPCKFTTCRRKETCQVQDNKAVCVPNYRGLCWAWGDPHCRSFDGHEMDFQGTCSYIFAQHVKNKNSDSTLEPFEIVIKNNNRGTQAASFVKLMKVTIYDTEISVQVGEFPKIQVNGVLTNLPVVLLDGKLNVTRSGFKAVVEAANSLVATFDWNWHCTVEIPSSYDNSVFGLCGNFNEDPNDDQRAPNGTIMNSIVDWASTWKVYDRDPFCFDYCPGQCPVCDDEKKRQYSGKNACGMLFTEDGPFRECLKKIKPRKFFDACLFDVCVNDGAQTMLCQALEAFATTCLNQGLQIYDWRTSSGCPKVCEDKNSHYNACGNACPASCSNRNAPATCAKPCIETCECNTGMVLSGSKCVPITNCGCQYNGQYYEPNQSWYDEKCTVLCKCDPILGTVDCHSSSCKKTETCMLSNGIRGCYPTEYSTCVSTHPHYNSFDLKRFSYMGSCLYRLVKVASNDSDLIPFTINILNDHRGNNAISFTKDVIIEVYNKTITMSKVYPQQIKVDGILVNLPYYFVSTKIIAFISGNNIVLRIEPDITVTYDGWNNVHVKLPSTYRGAVNGLCGNNNRNASDDFNFENGSVARTADEFGSHWKVGDVSGCINTCSNCTQCPKKDEELYKTEQYCGLLKKPNGPFSQCYNTIDPDPYFNNCVVAACAFKGPHTVVCASIALYVADCQKNGSVIEPWRKPSFCGMSCPPNSHYEFLENGCPATCFGLIAPPTCKPSPTEGCYCDNGFILSGKDCVPVPECGCVFENTYYKQGQEFYPDSLCKRQCTCDKHGVVNCKNTSCGLEEECKVVNGLLGCHPKEFGQCAAWGDPHFMTPDKLYFDFQGICSYKLIKAQKGQVYFDVTVDHEPFGKMAVIKSVTVMIGNYVIHLGRQRAWTILINGEKYNFPCRSHNRDIWINKEGNNVFVYSRFGFVVMFDQQFFVSVWIPSSYHGLTAGLCGNYNKDPKDDFRLPNGSIVTDKAVFGESWIVARHGTNCQGCSGDRCATCDEATSKISNSTTKCGIIVAPQGPFKECHQLVNPDIYYQSCLVDFCAGHGSQEALCASLQAYMALCQERGAKVGAWRNIAKCPMACGKNSHYELCTQTCGFTCYGLSAVTTCSRKCFEGCQCELGYMFDGEECVKMNKCGCTHNERYIKANEVVVSEDCSQRCSCQSGIASCVKASCARNEVCQLRDGVRGCHPRESQCVFTANHRFTTFDGVSGDFTLQGSYVLSSSCNRSQDQFMVVLDIPKCIGEARTKSSLQVFTSHGFISVNGEREVWLNGWKLENVSELADGAVKVNVSKSDITIELRDKLTVIFKANDEIVLIAKEAIAGKVCGPCGNFNRDASDDLRLKNGEPSRDIAFTIQSWAAKHLSTCMG